MKSLTKIILISGVGITLCVGLTFLAINPALNNVVTANQEIGDMKNELTTLENQVRAFKNAQSDLSKATRKNEIVDSIVTKETLVATVKELELAASRTNTIHVLEFSEPAPGSNKKSVINHDSDIEEVPIRITVINNYVGLLNFLSYLEHVRFAEISRADFSAEILEGDTATHTGRILGTIDGVFFVKTSDQ